MQKKSIIHTDLTGKVALITGASQGLGAYYAEVLAKNGAHVIASGRSSSEDRLKAVVHALNQQGLKASSLIIEMTDFGSFNENIEKLAHKFGSIDILVNNAGVSVDKDLFSISEEDWNFHMDTNLKGLFFLSQAVAKQMKQQADGGRIINITAVNGEKVRKNCIAFGTSKAGVIHLTKAMAYELMDYKIKVNAIELGLFPSDLVKDFLNHDPAAQDYLNQIPAKRAGKFMELEGPLLLLASSASDYMYGSVLKVDGGFAIDVFMNVDVKNS